MVSCTWLKDDIDDCPYGFWLKLHYTYNILDVEAAPKYVTDAYVYVYDADGNYIKRIYATKEDLVANDYRVRIENLPEGDYQFVVWSGIGNSQYAVSGDTQTIGDFRLSLVGASDSYAAELPALYHGYLQAVRDLCDQHGIECEVMIGEGSPVKYITEASKNYDLIVMGTLGRTGFSKLMMGSVAERVVRYSNCPVMVIRAPEDVKK